jgi:hypothetical protein
MRLDAGFFALPSNSQLPASLTTGRVGWMRLPSLASVFFAQDGKHHGGHGSDVGGELWADDW